MPAGCAPVSCPGRVQRGEAERNESRDPAQRLAQSNMADGCDPRVAPRSTQVGFTRLASSNCRSRASPDRCLAALARDTRVGRAHERAKSRLAHEPLAVVSSHDVKQRSVVRSRGALLRPGSLFSFRVHPPTRGGRSADRRTYVCCRVCETRRIRASEARRVP